MDVPYHFDKTGAKLLDIPLSNWIFYNVIITEVPRFNSDLIVSRDLNLKNIPNIVDLLLIRTGYEQFRKSDKYWKDNPGIAPEVAVYLRSHFPKLRCIGFDFISLTSWKHRDVGKLAHKEFLSPKKGNSPILIIEDLSLVNVSGNIKRVIVSPLMVENGNGGPVTVFGEQ